MELVELFRAQQATGFADVAGARAAAMIPISDRLLNVLLAQHLPESAPVRDVRIAPGPGNTFQVSASIKGAAFLPALRLRLQIDQQPDLPRSAVLVLRVMAGGLMALAGGALRMFDVLPPGVRLEGDRLHIDLRAIAAERGLLQWFAFLQTLHVATEEGRVIVTAEAAVPEGTRAGPRQS